MRLFWIFFLILSSCAVKPEHHQLTVAAAANLTDVCGRLGLAFEKQTGINTVFTYGSTAQLAKQIENGAPFDLFAAADTEHVDSLVASGKLIGSSRAVYACGKLALWAPTSAAIASIQDLARPAVRFVAVAQPDSAPYGKASVEALQHLNLWDQVRPKIVYTNSISQAKQLAASGNADAAFTAYSLVLHEGGRVISVDTTSYHRLDQGLGILTGSANLKEAQAFRDFLLAAAGRNIFSENGYLPPPSVSSTEQSDTKSTLPR